LLTIASPLTIAPPASRRGKATQNHIALPDTDEKQARAQEQKECKNAIYNKLPKTANFPVADGHVSFTCTFHYLGSFINYSLHDDNNITAQIASATAAMGSLKEIWRDPHLDMYNKYLLFQAIPMNLLLWGAETWSLRNFQLDQLGVFLNRSIH
jgi:hypothetical protein